MVCLVERGGRCGPNGGKRLESESPRAPLRLTFPATLAQRWMPGLFPEKAA
jgi:hypothetical protein